LRLDILKSVHWLQQAVEDTSATSPHAAGASRIRVQILPPCTSSRGNPASNINALEQTSSSIVWRIHLTEEHQQGGSKRSRVFDHHYVTAALAADSFIERFANALQKHPKTMDAHQRVGRW
jgi:hypothetical protein